MKTERQKKTSMQALNSALDKHIANLTDRELDEFLKAAKKAKDAVKAENERKRENQKKYILGGLVGWLLENNHISQAQLYDWLDKYLTRDQDRELFEFELSSDDDQVVESAEL